MRLKQLFGTIDFGRLLWRTIRLDTEPSARLYVFLTQHLVQNTSRIQDSNFYPAFMYGCHGCHGCQASAQCEKVFKEDAVLPADIRNQDALNALRDKVGGAALKSSITHTRSKHGNHKL